MQRIIDFLSGISSSISIVDNNEHQKVSNIFLEQNSPNPFNPTTTIEFFIPPEFSGQQVTLSIINILGQNISTLVNESAKTGRHLVSYDGSNLSSGIYLYRLTVGENSLTKKMLLTK